MEEKRAVIVGRRMFFSETRSLGSAGKPPAEGVWLPPEYAQVRTIIRLLEDHTQSHGDLPGVERIDGKRTECAARPKPRDESRTRIVGQVCVPQSTHVGSVVLCVVEDVGGVGGDFQLELF